MIPDAETLRPIVAAVAMLAIALCVVFRDHHDGNTEP